MKLEGYLRLRFRVRVVNDYADERFSKIKTEYFCNKEKVLACSYMAQIEPFEQKNRGRKSCDTVPRFLTSSFFHHSNQPNWLLTNGLKYFRF